MPPTPPWGPLAITLHLFLVRWLSGPNTERSYLPTARRSVRFVYLDLKVSWSVGSSCCVASPLVVVIDHDATLLLRTIPRSHRA